MRCPRLPVVAIMLTGTAPSQSVVDYEGEPIRYGQREPDDPVARLRDRTAAEQAHLTFDAVRGYLPALLEALDVSPASQGLVFSKTSFQNRLISPFNPRAVYFGDEVYIGYVPGGDVLEITAMDPVQGPIFYTLDQRAADAPKFRRRTHDCLSCHARGWTGEWPGNLVRSVYPDPSGHPSQSEPTFVTTHDSALERRWGGWYVTGTHGAQRHMGNVTIPENGEAKQLDREAGANVTELEGRLATDRYLTPHSDIVALMVLEHQTHMHNLLARASYEIRRALHVQKETNRAMGDPPDHMSEVTRRRLREVSNEVLEYLLFKNEAPLEAEIRGTSPFAGEFAARGPRDEDGRSLRELDLKTRLFRYPCSYVIYSPCFDRMPKAVLDIVYTRLWRILTGRFGRRAWRLTQGQRQAILDILLATKPGLPSYWQPVVVR